METGSALNTFSILCHSWESLPTHEVIAKAAAMTATTENPEGEEKRTGNLVEVNYLK